jgi:poly(A) polymerase
MICSEEVLSKLNKLVKDFVRRISLNRNLPEAVANEAGGKIYTYGSYRLGVHGTGSFLCLFALKDRCESM